MKQITYPASTNEEQMIDTILGSIGQFLIFNIYRRGFGALFKKVSSINEKKIDSTND